MKIIGNVRKVMSGEKKIIIIPIIVALTPDNRDSLKSKLQELITDEEIVVIEFSEGCSYISSFGIAVLIGLLKKLNEKKNQLRAYTLNNKGIQEFFKLSMLDTVIPFYETESEATMAQ